MKPFLKISAAIVICALFKVCQAAEGGQERVSCITSAASMGGEGHITCQRTGHFVGNVSVSLEKTNSTHNDTHILDCNWDEEAKDTCTHIKPGYKIASIKENTFMVSVDEVTPDHLGQYRCIVMDNIRSYGSEHCVLEVPSTVPPSRQPQPSTTVSTSPPPNPSGDTCPSDPEKGMLTFDSGISIGIGIGIGIGIVIVIVIVIAIVIVGIGVYHYSRHGELGIPSCCLRCLEWVRRRLPFPGQGGRPDGGDTDQEQQNEGDNIQMENQGDGQNAPSATGGAADNRADHRTTPPPADPQEGVTGPEESNTENEESSPFLKSADPLSAPPGIRQKGEQSLQPGSSHYSHT